MITWFNAKMIKVKGSFNILIKLLHICLFVLLAIGMIHCNYTQKETPTKKTAQQTAPPGREEPRLVYDDNGNITERHAKSYRKSDGSVRSVDSYFYKYDRKNKLIEEIKESFTAKGELIYKNKSVFTYDKKDQKTEMQFFAYDKNDSLQRQARTTFEYNYAGYQVVEKSYFSDGNLKGEIIREPDEKGDLISEEFIHYNPDGSKKDHKKYYYTAYGLDRTEDLMEQ